LVIYGAMQRSVLLYANVDYPSVYTVEDWSTVVGLT